VLAAKATVAQKPVNVGANSALEQAGLLAQQAGYVSASNPSVGCVIVHATGGGQNQNQCQGHTQPPGQAHAEVMALRDAAAKGLSTQGATAYVTLEPCSHYGRTPPCCNALIDAGVAKVVVAILDPNPLVSGRGVQLLRAAGIEVEVLPPDSPEAVASRELNLGFFSRMVRQKPWVRMKVAASLDGQTALANGQSQWITGPAARADGHAWRARACAVLTGIGTVLQDDPLLDVRHGDTPRQPHLVIVDSQLETPLTAKLFTTLGKRPVAPELAAKFNLSKEAADAIAGRAIYIYAAVPHAAKQAALEALGASVIYMPEQAAGNTTVNPGHAKVDLRAMVRDLAQRDINDLHVEAGFKLNGSLLKAGVVDELLLYTAPKLLGPGMGIANTPAITQLADAVQLDFKSADLVGEDLRVVARLRGRDKF
jgi:diaminohydroxyphosphoribosylaminopyrimidine deaminase / 5-amino-6-(5-phosphoribosylamino)uracil reductase